MTTNPNDLLDPIAESACESAGVHIDAMRDHNRKPRTVRAARREFIRRARTEIVRNARYLTRCPHRPRQYARREEQPTWKPISTKDLAAYMHCDHSTIIHTLEELGLKPKGSPCPT